MSKYIVVGHTDSNYSVVKIDGLETQSSIVTYNRLIELVNIGEVINYERDHQSIQYNQGSEKRLEVKEDARRLFIINKLIQADKPVGFDVLTVYLEVGRVYYQQLIRLSYSDTIKIIERENIDCINAKISMGNISAIVGTFNKIELPNKKG